MPAANLSLWLRALLLMGSLLSIEDCQADAQPASARRPNVVLVMTDDQGYGDLSCLGNDELKTPNLDRLHSESVRLTNFHVDPTCSPTRSALMTGRYSSRTGVWHTIAGRSLMAPDETTLAERFSDAGYRTAIFGKWHLGDNFPCRPQDQGFHKTLIHGGGGVGQTPDFWGNDYFDDTYLDNGHNRTLKGYCTDVWFREAATWIESNRDEPFLVYLPTNAAHGPYNVAKEYSQPFKNAGIESPRAEFYGMIVNIDENVGRLRKKLDELSLAENTIFVFLTDNGTAAGHKNGGFNAGMRGNKGSQYEGGHRVPCFIYWPAGNLGGGHDVDFPTAHIDLLPTLCGLCGVEVPDADSLDGIDLSHYLHPDMPNGPAAPARILTVHSQRIETPVKWRNCAVMTDRWRLIDGKELYDILEDPDQSDNVASANADVVAELRAEYERWWDHVGERFDDYVRIEIGNDAAPVVELTCHDWHTDGAVPWHQDMVARDPLANGFWALQAAVPGRYEFVLRRRPAEAPAPLIAQTAEVAAEFQSDSIKGERSSNPETVEATLDILEAVPPVGTTASKQLVGGARLMLELPAGALKLTTKLAEANGKVRGAYYVTVRRLEEE